MADNPMKNFVKKRRAMMRQLLEPIIHAFIKTLHKAAGHDKSGVIVIVGRFDANDPINSFCYTNLTADQRDTLLNAYRDRYRHEGEPDNVGVIPDSKHLH